MKQVAIISIGDEILAGQTVNTNAAWLANRLTAIGLRVSRVEVVADDRSIIAHTVSAAAEYADLVITTGGLGPTHDDRTRQAICDLLGCDMTVDSDQLARIESGFRQRGLEANERSRQQAFVPSMCRRLPNMHGNAPGLAFTIKRAQVYVLPGVPMELQGIVDEFVVPELHAAGGRIRWQTFLLFGITESALADRLSPAEANLNTSVTLACLPSPGGIRLHAMLCDGGPGDDERFQRMLDAIRSLGRDVIVADEDITLVTVVARLMRDRRWTFAAVESCTGGLLASTIVTEPGASDWFMGSLVLYANSMKVGIVGVRPEVIAKHGAVSGPVAQALAAGGRDRTGVDVAVAITGIAGPGGGTVDKPAGTVFIAVATNLGVDAFRFQLGPGRSVVRQRAIWSALDLVRRNLLGLPVSVETLAGLVSIEFAELAEARSLARGSSPL